MSKVKKRRIHHNLNIDKLISHALKRKEAILSRVGALTVSTGKYTGRSPNDRFIVDDRYSHQKINWGKVNLPLTPKVFDNLYRKVGHYLSDLNDLYIFNGLAGADTRYQLKVKIVCELAYQNLFAFHMLLKPPPNCPDFKPDFTIFVAPKFKADPKIDKTNSEAFIIINFSQKVVLIGGTQYAGEIKKAIFTIMNFLLPQKGVLPMHCSANIGKSGDTALFFGLSGTGKTTLSADPKRKLIGDDEHGWSREGIFNFEAGCYAKCINLNAKSEPHIYQAIKRGAICENVVLNPQTLEYDFTDSRYTENSRATFPLSHIPGSVPSGRGNQPKTIIFLTADAFGVLPPVAKLNINGAVYHFLSGYTSKLAGTERGIKEPKATFSTLFGEPFMPLNPLIYAGLLRKYLKKYKPEVFLVNTGWINGPYGTGKRISIELTRKIVTAALDGLFKKVRFRHDSIFNLDVPKSLPNATTEIFNPANGWKDKNQYWKKAKELAQLFQKNFKRFPNASKQIIAAGPKG